MKRIVKIMCLCMVFCLLFGTVVFAEGVDLSSMSLMELVKLHQALDKEIDARIGCQTSTIAEGVYTAGKSIKPGMYRIVCQESFGEEGLIIQTFANESDYSSYKLGTGYGLGSAYNNLMNAYVVYSGSIEKGKAITVQLTQGMVLYIGNGIGEIHTIVADWAM